MVTDKITIGVIGIQGAVSEHVAMMKHVFSSINGDVDIIKPADSLDGFDGVILPGGESTTISRVLRSSGLFDELYSRVSEGSLAVMGTCAGCILLSDDIVDNSKDIDLLKLLSIRVRRNAYGRQRESFEQLIDLSELNPSSDSSFPAIFIRAPVIEQVKDKNISVLAYDMLKKPVMVQKNNILALTFHPELSNDDRIHRYFLSLVKKTVV